MLLQPGHLPIHRHQGLQAHPRPHQPAQLGQPIPRARRAHRHPQIRTADAYPTANRNEFANPHTITNGDRTPTARPTIPPTATPAAPPSGSVTLLAPLDATLKGRHTFRWQTTATLGTGQLFEMVFWEAGKQPMQDSFGPIGAQAATEVFADLDKVANILPNLLISGRDYQWGVLIVELNPYRRILYLGGGHQFRFERSGGGGGGDGGGPAPNTPTPFG